MGWLLALALAAAPCPPPTGEAKDNVELKGRAHERAECLKAAVEKSAPRSWAKVEAEFARWASDICAAEEALSWVDLAKRVKFTGTAVGLAESQCLQRLWADRLALVEATAKKEAPPVGAGDAEQARKAVDAAEATRARLVLARLEAGTEPRPAGGKNPVADGVPLADADYGKLKAQLDHAVDGASSLAGQQCPLVTPSQGCESMYALHLLALLHLEAH